MTAESNSYHPILSHINVNKQELIKKVKKNEANDIGGIFITNRLIKNVSRK